jgi:hypothetical protein
VVGETGSRWASLGRGTGAEPVGSGDRRGSRRRTVVGNQEAHGDGDSGGAWRREYRRQAGI